MHRGQDAAAYDERAEDAQEEGDHDQDQVPRLEHAAAFLHLDAVNEGRADEPGHQRDILDRVPAPVSAPAEHVIGPPRAQDVAQAKNDPGHHAVAPRQGDPLVAQSASGQRGNREREGYGPAHQARQQHRRVNAHALVVQQRIEADAIGRRAGQRLKGRSDEAQQQGHEAEDRHHHGDHVRHEHAVRTGPSLLP